MLLKKYIKDSDELLSTAGWIITKVIKSAPKFDPSKPAMAYINRICTNYAIDLYRHSSASRRAEGSAISRTTSSKTEELEMNIDFLIDEVIGEEDAVIVKKVILNKEGISNTAASLGINKKEVRECMYRAEVNTKAYYLDTK